MERGLLLSGKWKGFVRAWHGCRSQANKALGRIWRRPVKSLDTPGRKYVRHQALEEFGLEW